MTTSTLSVVLPTWNNSEWTLRCLDALERNTRSALHVIWVDNGSTADEHDRVRSRIAEFDHDLEHHPEPLGFARAINRGIPYLRDGYAVFLNNDVTVCPNWDVPLRRAVDDAPGAAGPLALGGNAGWQNVAAHRWLGDLSHSTSGEVARRLRSTWGGKVIDLPARPRRPPFRGMLAFFCVLFPSEVVRKIGRLDERFGWGYCEDDDYCERLRRAGLSIMLCLDSVVEHAVSRTLQHVRDDWRERLARNMRAFEQKWGRPID